MTSTITKGTLNQFHSMLGLNRRVDWRVDWRQPQGVQRVRQIDVSIDPTRDIVGKVADRFWGLRPTYNGTALAFKEEFERSGCCIRIVRTSNADWPEPKNTGGYIVLDGELLALHSVIRGQGDWLMNSAVDDGAQRLSCYDERHLITLYTKHGFREVRRELNTTKGRPDVVWMERHGNQS